MASCSRARSPLISTALPQAWATPQASDRVPSMPEAPRKASTGRGGPSPAAKLSQSRTGELLASTKGTPAGRSRLSWRARAGSQRPAMAVSGAAAIPAMAKGAASWLSSQACRACSAACQRWARARLAAGGSSPCQVGGRAAHQGARPLQQRCWAVPRASRLRGSASLIRAWGPLKLASHCCSLRLAGSGPSRSSCSGCHSGLGAASSRS